MKKTTIIAIIITVLATIVGYILGNILPFKNFTKGIENNSPTTQNTEVPENKGRLVVMVKNTNNEPIVGIEIDIAVQPGPPEEWGVQEADLQGTVEYNLDPGSYYVFFNMNRFPNEYVIQAEKQVTITAGKQEDVVFILEKE